MSVVRIDELCVLAAQLPHLLRAPRPCRSATQSSRKIRAEPNSAMGNPIWPAFPAATRQKKIAAGHFLMVHFSGRADAEEAAGSEAVANPAHASEPALVVVRL